MFNNFSDVEIYEIKLKIKLNKEILFRNYPEFVANNINKILFNSLLFRSLHINNSFKPYVVGSLNPLEKDKVYKKDKNYILTIRTIDESFCNEFLKASKRAYNLDFEIENIEIKELKVGFIDTLYTITPAIITISKNRYWTQEDDLQLLFKAIKKNLEKKYYEFYRQELTTKENIIPYIELKNEKPIVFNYKKGKLFSNRFKIAFESDKNSQKLAKLALGVGILEKNTLGFGMVVKGR